MIVPLVTFVWLSCQIRLSSCQSPCPDVFVYVANRQTNIPEGRITISDTRPGWENSLWIKMSYPSYVVNQSPGSLGPTRNNKDIVKDIERRQPVYYRVNFPTISPLPTVHEIMHNGRTICRGQGVARGASQIVLHYNLKVPQIYQINFDGSLQQRVQPQIEYQQTYVRQQQQQQHQQRQQPQRRPQFRQADTHSSYECGSSTSPISFIIGGEKMQPGSWPWLAAMFIRKSRKYICAGSIIAPHAIITAAHCVVNGGRVKRPQSILIGLGLFDVFNWNEPDTHIASVSNIIPHADYADAAGNFDADVALVMLDRSYSYNYRIRPICMWQGSRDLNQVVNREGHVAGWGVSRLTGESDKIPNIVETEIVSLEKCHGTHVSSYLSNRNFCAGYLNGRGPCKGDSGSGLMIDVNGRWYIRGIVAGGLFNVKTSCELYEYIIYTDIAKFTRWIDAKMGK